MNVLTDLGGAFLYFTALLPIWSERPLTKEDIVPPGPYPLEVKEQQVAFARQGFNYADEDLANTMILSFGKSQTPPARDALLRLAKDQSMPSVVATALLQMGNLPLNNQELERKLAAFFTHDDWQVRFWAVSTYGKLPAPVPAALLQVARKDPSSQVKTAALEAMAGRAGQLAFTGFSDLLTDDSRVIRHAALLAAMGTRDVEAGQDKIAALLVSPDVSDRHAVAAGLARLPKPLALRFGQSLADDEHPSVRAECAVQMGKVPGAESRKILIGLLDDKDYEVRRSAVESLVSFPEPGVVERLSMMLEDKNRFVRRQLEDTLVTLHPRQAVDVAVVKECLSKNPEARLLAYNVLGRIGVERHRDTIAKTLPSETSPANVAAALKALESLTFTASDTVILPYVTHADTLVRKASVGALGNFKTEATATALINLAADPDNDVVAAAIESMGRVANPVFSEILLKILKDTNSETSRYTEAHRGQACWALAKLPVIQKNVAKRLVEQGTKPVIKTEMGNVFEGDQVLVSVIFALAEQARKNPAAVKDFNKVYRVHSRKWTDKEMMASGGNVLLPTPELLEYSAQAKTWLDDRPVQPGLRPKRSMKFLYRPVK